jgi:TetR/AcrR family transcriptional regulator, acrAB operon repressor
VYVYHDMARRTKTEAEATRQQILDAAEVVFSKQGVARSSLADIAARAGVTRGAIYWHFNNKLDVLNALLERVISPIQAVADAIVAAASADPLRNLRESTVQILQKTAMDKRTQRVFDIVINKCELVDEMAVARESCLACRNRCIQTMERGFRAARRRGQLRAGVTPRAAAIGLHALVEGLISSWMLAPEQFRLASIAAVSVDAYLGGLRQPGALGKRT